MCPVGEKPNQVLTLKDRAMLSAITDGQDQARYPVYSILHVPAAGVTPISFFSTPEGGTQNVGALANSMTRDRTNMQKANAFATPNSYILKAIKLAVLPLITSATPFSSLAFAQDIYFALATGHMRVVIGNKEFFYIAPLMMLSAGFGLEGQIATTQSAADRSYLTNNHPLIFKVEPWIYIPSEVNFKVEIAYDAAPNLSAVTRYACILDGDIIRAVQ